LAEPPKDGRHHNAGHPEHEQERSGATAEIRPLHGAAVTLEIRPAASSLTDKSRFSAVMFQEPGATTESEALQLRGHDVAVAHGTYCVAWRVCTVLGHAAGPPSARAAAAGAPAR